VSARAEAPTDAGAIVATRHRAKSSFRSITLVLHAILIGMTVVYAVPLFWMFSTSLKLSGHEIVYPPEWIPNPISWDNYPQVFRLMPVALYTRNTLFVAATATLFGVFTASLAGYGFAHLRFPGRNVMFSLCLSAMMLPGVVTLIPEFLLFKQIGLINTFVPLILPWSLAGSAFAVFLFRQYALTIPLELDEAAKVDGAGVLRIWWDIIVPLSKPVLATMAILSLTHHWNDFMRPLVYLGKPEVRTLALGLRSFKGEQNLAWNYMMVLAMLMLIPILVLFFFAQKQFVQGIVMTGIKG
jgi:multiple sugar transport system permease protein